VVQIVARHCTTIGALLHTYTPQECENYLTNSGYDGRNVILSTPVEN